MLKCFGFRRQGLPLNMALDDKLSFCATQTDLGLDLILIIQVCANFSVKPRVATVGMECNGVLSTYLWNMKHQKPSWHSNTAWLLCRVMCGSPPSVTGEFAFSDSRSCYAHKANGKGIPIEKKVMEMNSVPCQMFTLHSCRVPLYGMALPFAFIVRWAKLPT